MSRALTVFNRRDRDSRENKDDLEKVRGHAGCSEPVARNLLKYAKFGIGPLSGKEPQALPSEAEKATSVLAAAPPIKPLDKKEKLRELEKKLQAQQREEEPEQEAKKSSANPFEVVDMPAKKRMKPRIGIISLGSVEKRPEEVDPLKAEAAPPAPPEEDDDDDSFFAAPRIAIREFREKPAVPAPPKPKQQQQQQKPGKKKKNKRKNAKGETDESSSDSETRKKANTAGQAPAEGGGKGGARSSGSLMSEAEVMAMMRPDRKQGVKPQRGSLAAKLRIQKEQQEWESRKADNEEFWKAPKFALCYSAETKRMRGAG